MAQKSNLRFTKEETAETVDPKEAAGFSKKKAHGLCPRP